jgi:hypothetical protein
VEEQKPDAAKDQHGKPPPHFVRDYHFNLEIYMDKEEEAALAAA